MLACLGCAPAPSSSGEKQAGLVETEVRAAVAAFAQAERDLDPAAALRFIGPGFYMYVDGRRADESTVRQQIASTLPTLKAFDTEWQQIEVTPIGADHALVSLVFVDRITDADGTLSQGWGPTTFLWQRFGDGWKLIYADADHYPGFPSEQ